MNQLPPTVHLHSDNIQICQRLHHFHTDHTTEGNRKNESSIHKVDLFVFFSIEKRDGGLKSSLLLPWVSNVHAPEKLQLGQNPC